jgi:ABC-2 type transport system permease protein
MKSLWQLTSVNYKEFLREPEIVFWSLIFPIMMAWVLGAAFSKKEELVQTIAIVNNHSISNPKLVSFLKDAEETRGNYSNEITEYRKTFINDKLGKSSYRLIPVNWDSAVLMLKRGETSIIIQDSQDSLLYHFDPRNPEAKLSYIMLSSAVNNEPVVYENASIKPLEQKGTRYIDFLIPGLLALGIMNSFLWGIGYGLIEMRSKKLLRRMVATPMKKSYYIISHFFGRISLVIIEAAVLLLFAWIYFRIQIQGSILALIMIFLAGNICFSGIAVLLASRTSSSRVGNGLINMISMPMMVLSGIFFSYHNFPEFVVPVIQKLPLTMLADSIRGIFTEGTGIRDNLPAFFILSGFGLISFFIGLRIYKWY